jgi:hypothetical protein
VWLITTRSQVRVLPPLPKQVPTERWAFVIVSSMNKQRGFSPIVIVLLLAVLAIIGSAGFIVYKKHSTSVPSSVQSGSTVKIGDYKLWLDANEDDNFKTYYSLGLTGTQNVIPQGQSGKIKVSKLKIAKSDSVQITIDAQVHEEDWTRPSCELIEPWDCDPPALETKVDLPKLTSGQPASVSLTLNIDGKKQNYTINTKDYKLSISGADGFSTNILPLYPDGIASAIAVNQIKNSLCESVSSSQIVERLKDSNVQLASGKYKGIENVRPNDVLVYVPGKHLNDTVAPASSSCVIKIIPANLKQIN